jgi:hypothetical protein
MGTTRSPRRTTRTRLTRWGPWATLAAGLFFGFAIAVPPAAAMTSSGSAHNASQSEVSGGIPGLDRVYSGVTIQFPAGVSVRAFLDPMPGDQCYKDPTPTSTTTTKPSQEVVLSFVPVHVQHACDEHQEVSTTWQVAVTANTVTFHAWIRFGQKVLPTRPGDIDSMCLTQPRPTMSCTKTATNRITVG